MAERLRQRLDLALVERGLFESRAKARAAIEAGGVRIDGQVAAKPSDLVAHDSLIEAEPAHPYVGRGALKLAHALHLWPIEIRGRVGLDIGASTGGFTQVLLLGGAKRVFAVDVGRGQLHASLTSDERVLSLEGRDVRSLTAGDFGEAPDVVVCDVSFISLGKALPAPLRLAAPKADLVALIKPQFEVGRARVGKRGIVKDPGAQQEAVDAVRQMLGEQGWSVQATGPSPISGGDGNAEWLVWARRG